MELYDFYWIAIERPKTRNVITTRLPRTTVAIENFFLLDRNIEMMPKIRAMVLIINTVPEKPSTTSIKEKMPP